MRLTLRDVSAYFGKSQALYDVSMDVATSEIVCVLGLNGAGKSTLLRSISGLHAARTGSIRLGERELSRLPAHEIARLGVAHVMQGRRIFAGLTVEQNLVLGSFRLRSQNERERRHVRDEVLDLFPILSERLAQRAGTLSGGQQQMLAIARSLMSAPEVLLLDEPSLGLAPIVIRPILDSLRRLKTERHLTVVLVEQNPTLALGISDRCYVLGEGRVVVSGVPSGSTSVEQIAGLYLGQPSSQPPAVTGIRR